jgi:outer membrane protein
VDGLARGVTPPPVPADMQQWIDTARDTNYQVVLKQLAVANSQRETLKAKAGHYPTLDLVTSYAKSSLGATARKTNAVNRLSMPQ